MTVIYSTYQLALTLKPLADGANDTHHVLLENPSPRGCYLTNKPRRTLEAHVTFLGLFLSSFSDVIAYNDL